MVYGAKMSDIDKSSESVPCNSSDEFAFQFTIAPEELSAFELEEEAHEFKTDHKVPVETPPPAVDQRFGELYY